MSGSSPTTGTNSKNRAASMVARFLLSFHAFGLILLRSQIEQAKRFGNAKIKNQTQKC